MASGGSTPDLGERIKFRWKKVVASVEKAIEKVKRKKHAAQNDDNENTEASKDTETPANANVSNTTGNPNVSEAAPVLRVDPEVPVIHLTESSAYSFKAVNEASLKYHFKMKKGRALGVVVEGTTSPLGNGGPGTIVFNVQAITSEPLANYFWLEATAPVGTTVKVSSMGALWPVGIGAGNH
jgi:hypothetical protein